MGQGQEVYMKTMYIKLMLMSIFAYTSATCNNHCDNSFKLIKDISGTYHGQTWAVKAYESPDEIKIYVKNLFGLFDPQSQLLSPWSKFLSFRISSEGAAVQVVFDKEKNPTEGGYGPAGGFDLPLQAAKELWSTCNKVHYIDPVQVSQDEILLTVPKYKSESRLYDWWHRKPFTVWTMPLD